MFRNIESCSEYRNIIRKLINNVVRSVEIIASDKCQNACKYCYRVKDHVRSDVVMISGDQFKYLLDRCIDFFGFDVTNKKKIELFGGDVTVRPDYLVDYLKIINDYNFSEIVIPTNGRFLSELSRNDLADLFKICKIPLIFSLSIDGSSVIERKQRPLSTFGKMFGFSYESVEKLIEFCKCKDFRMGLHPMFDFDSVDTWIDQFEFFLSNNFSFYMLEVRHSVKKDVAKKALINIRKMFEILINRTKIRSINQLKFYNMFAISYVPRGLGCSLHTTISIHHSGNIPVCHRLLHQPFIVGNIFKQEIDINRFFYYRLIDKRNFYPCVLCPIRDLCTGQCLGASFEQSGDITYIDQSICMFFIAKFILLINLHKRYLEEHHVDFILSRMNYDEAKNIVESYFGSSFVIELISD